MSYANRVYRQRNAHTHDEAKNEAFFGKRYAVNNDNKKGGFFQTKLSVNQPGDSYEKEADTVASTVINRSSQIPVVQQKKISSIQRLSTSMEDEKLGTNDARMLKDKEIQEKPMQSSEDLEKEKLKGLQKKDNPLKEEDELKAGAVQTKPEGNAPTASAQLSSRLESKASTGNKLSGRVLNEMNNSFGMNFNHVNIHTDAESAQMNQELSAQAFTNGNDIYFNKGKYNPENNEGKFLLAHELTHVVQQSGELNQRHNSVQRAAIHTGNILDEGSCAHLACDSKWACDDPDGVTCPSGTKWAGKSKSPLFTCDKECSEARTCSDTSNWMAIPKSRFGFKKCAQNLVICANGTSTHAEVADKSEKEAWEVSHGVQDDLGVSPYAKFKGSIYGSDSDKGFKTDKNCNP